MCDDPNATYLSEANNLTYSSHESYEIIVLFPLFVVWDRDSHWCRLSRIGDYILHSEIIISWHKPLHVSTHFAAYY